MYKIYSLKNYKVATKKNENGFNEPLNVKLIENDNIDIISNELMNNKGFHLYLHQNTNYILYADLDYIDKFDNIVKIIDAIAEQLNISSSEVKYTMSQKTKDDKIYYSVHIMVPNKNANLKQQYNLWLAIRNTNPLLLNYIDLQVYKGGWWRLPYQILEGKKQYHSLINCTMKDCILNYITERSLNISNDNYDIKGKKNYSYDKTIQYKFSDEQIIELLNSLPSNYLNDYSDWMVITTIMKSIHKKIIWQMWSQESENYNELKNNSIWRGIKKYCFDVNYLVYIVNTKTTNKFNYFESYKVYKPLCFNYGAIDGCESRVSNILTYDNFKDNDNIIIQSGTGTGKTYCIADYIYQYVNEEDNKHYKLLNIFNLKSLGYQHTKSFEKLDVMNYEDGFKSNTHYSVCLNSLVKLQNLTNNEMSNYIIFIDEVYSLINSLTHNNTITNIKTVYNTLMRLIKHCHKIVLCDNLINDNVFELIEMRNQQEQIFIKNSYSKYEGTNARRCRDENKFLELLLSHIENEEYFLFGADSCTDVERYYNYCIQNLSKDYIDKHFVLITKNHPKEIKDASKELKNTYTFYSPSIVTGLNFEVDDKQDVFLLISNGSTLDAQGSFQQLSRTRNINTLYYYSEIKERKPEYTTLSDLKEQYKQHIITSNELNNICLVLDEEDYEMKIQESKFFNLYCYNQYVNDIYQTNRTLHFENILIQNKFIIKSQNIKHKQDLDKETKIIMKELTEEEKEELFIEYIDNDDKTIKKYETIDNRKIYLNLPDDKITLQEYKNVLMSDYHLDKHINSIRILKTDEYITKKINNNDMFKVQAINTSYNKIGIIRKYEKQFNLKPLDINYDKNDVIDINNNMWLLTKKLFRTTIEKPQNMTDFKKLYIHMIKNITGSDFIKSKKTSKDINGKKQTYYKYDINDDYIKQQLKLNSFINPNCSNFHQDFKDKYDIVEKQEQHKNYNVQLLDFD